MRRVLEETGEQMSEKELRASRYLENFIPQNIIDESVHQVCESVADAFLGQIEYGKDYVLNTELAKEDWADGFGTKYTYNLKFDELVRCRDCRHYYEAEEYHPQGNYKKLCCKHFFTFDDEVNPNGFCAWGERKVVGE